MELIKKDGWLGQKDRVCTVGNHFNLDLTFAADRWPLDEGGFKRDRE